MTFFFFVFDALSSSPPPPRASPPAVDDDFGFLPRSPAVETTRTIAVSDAPALRPTRNGGAGIVQRRPRLSGRGPTRRSRRGTGRDEAGAARYFRRKRLDVDDDIYVDGRDVSLTPQRAHVARASVHAPRGDRAALVQRARDAAPRVARPGRRRRRSSNLFEKREPRVDRRGHSSSSRASSSSSRASSSSSRASPCFATRPARRRAFAQILSRTRDAPAESARRPPRRSRRRPLRRPPPIRYVAAIKRSSRGRDVIIISRRVACRVITARGRPWSPSPSAATPPRTRTKRKKSGSASRSAAWR